MRWITFLGAALTLTFVSASSHAGLNCFSGGSKHSGCAESSQPECCVPTISRPCSRNIYNYQRRNSHLKASCCVTTSDCAPASCCAPVSCCAPASCCAPVTAGNGVQNSCCAPAACADNCTNTCCAPTECSPGSFCTFTSGDIHPGCAESTAECSTEGCCDKSTCEEIATLIYQSMTECYATARRTAIHRLGDRYDCCEHPEVMNAFIYALNDSDERVRAKAADEIGDQIRRNRCVCGMPVIRALQCALADCDRNVRRQAEEALHWSGYAIVNGNPNGCVGECCSVASATTYPQSEDTVTTHAVMVPAPAPAPAPVEFEPSRVEPFETTMTSVSAGSDVADAEESHEQSERYFAPRLHNAIRTATAKGDSKPFSFGRF